jgi:hypothetical protein
MHCANKNVEHHCDEGEVELAGPAFADTDFLAGSTTSMSISSSFTSSFSLRAITVRLDGVDGAGDGAEDGEAEVDEDGEELR